MNKTVIKQYLPFMARPNATFLRRILTRPGAYKEKKEEYKSKIIDAPESPTGKAYVGINKSPFMPAAENGHGYQGVLLQDDNREFIQCHACGKWMQKNTAFHLKQCCGLTVPEYKTKYGLNHDQGLVSDETSLRLTKACLMNTRPYVVKSHEGVHGRKSRPHSMEFFNKHGTCPLQLKTRLYEFIHCNRELPSQHNRGRRIYRALTKRYGSFGHALSAHGLPWMRRKGTTLRFAFADGSVYAYNLNQFYDREALYNLMVKKCPVLSPSTK